MALQDILARTPTVVAANGLALLALQKGEDVLNQGLATYSTFENFAVPAAIYGATAFGAYEYGRTTLAPHVRRTWRRDRTAAIIAGTLMSLPILAAFGLAYKVRPVLTGAVEEVVQNGLALGSLALLNYYLFVPGAEALRAVWDSGRPRIAKYTALTALAGTLLFTDGVKNSARDVYNTALAAKHEFQDAKKRDINDYFLQDGMSPPVNGPVIARFGYRLQPLNTRAVEFHSAIDIGAAEGTPVTAPKKGRVLHIEGKNPDKTIIIDTSGTFSHQEIVLKHLEGVKVEEGQTLDQGQELGKVGKTATGPHICFQKIDSGLPSNPL